VIDSPSKIDRDDRSPWQRACDEARADTARLASQLESITAENHSRAQRESQSLEDWAALRAEVESLKAQLDLAHKFHDVAVKERDYYKTRLSHAEAEIEAIHNTHETKGGHA
jgi:chromosome segregation ATPase